MKHYLVSLKLSIGEHEKSSNRLVVADNEQSAGTLALISECHNEPDFEDDKKQSCWDCGEMIYRVQRVKELSDKDYEEYKRITKDVFC